MRVLFLTTGRFNSIYQRGLYPDLLRFFMMHGHEVYIVSSREKRENLQTELKVEDNSKNLCVRIGNLTQTNLIEKGISTLLIEYSYKKAIQKYFSDIKFDLIMYSTPPITLVNVVSFLKKRDNAKTYLILKDIFPQNAVDLEILKKPGLIYNYFRKKEKKLYEISDYIGCMSDANVKYVINNNTTVKKDCIEVCPNSIEIIDMRINLEVKMEIRRKYNLPLDSKIFLYGGNLGKPQGVPFIIECLKSQLNNKNSFFLIVGDGTEFNKLNDFFEKYKPTNMKLMKRIPKDDYDRMVAACDVGMIFLDHRFTIPNFPSRLLSLLQAGLPVLTCTDVNTDIGNICIKGGFGWWCESNNIKKFNDVIKIIELEDLHLKGSNGFEYLKENYDVEVGYNVIISHFEEK